MELQEIARRVVSANREGRVEDLLDACYAEDVVSVEPRPGPHGHRETRGLDFLRAKHEWWRERFAVVEAEVEGPFLHGPDRFGVRYRLEAERRTTGARRAWSEIALYTVRDGKVAREEFFAA